MSDHDHDHDHVECGLLSSNFDLIQSLPLNVKQRVCALKKLQGKSIQVVSVHLFIVNVMLCRSSRTSTSAFTSLRLSLRPSSSRFSTRY